MFKRLFWNPTEQRIAAIWRIALQLVFLIAVISIPNIFIGIILGFTGNTEAISSLPMVVLMSVIVCVGMVLSVFLAGRILDRRTFKSFGFSMNKKWWGDLAFGLGLGAILMVIIFLMEWLLGYVTITDTFAISNPKYSFLPLILSQVVLFIAVGIQEEVLSRGYHLKNLGEGLNVFKSITPRTAVILSTLISSAIFGLLHANNPNASFISTFNIFLAGIMLAAGYLFTKQLAIPIGLHITWNFFQGNVFGFPVSGTNSNATSFIEIQQSGPDWFTGGAFGPEAGVIGLLMMGLGVVAIWAYSTRVHGSSKVQKGLAIPQFLPKHKAKLESIIVVNGENIVGQNDLMDETIVE